MNTTATDQRLDRITLAQLVWKSGPSRDVAEAIIRRALTCDGLLWPDEVEVTLADEHRNCIGSSWRTLTKFGVIEPTGRFRRSAGQSANGRKVFEYRVRSLALAKRWLIANGLDAPQDALKQVEMFG